MNTEIEKYLTKVIESPEFKTSVKYQKLLDYLVKSSLSGNIPKEITIACDVFNIEYEHSASGESNVRVYVYNLRKKLELYYADEGKDDSLRFVISKGAYKVDFVKKKEISGRPIPFRLIGFAAASLAGIVLVAFGAFYFFRDSDVKYTSDYVWSDFTHNDLPVLVVIGDYYLVKDDSYPNRVRYIRDSRINSDEDWIGFMNSNSNENGKYYKTRHTFFGKFAPFCMNELTSYFALRHRKFEIILASDFQWHDIQNNNVIYVGSFKSLGLLKNLLKNSNFEFFAFPNELKFRSLNPDSVFHYYSFDSNVDNALESDYAVVTKLKATNNTNILFFLSTRDIGLVSMVKYFTSQDSLKHFEYKYLKQAGKSSGFESCFKVLGLHRTTKSVELMHVNNLLVKE